LTDQWTIYLDRLAQGDIRALARCISLVENEVPGSRTLLERLPDLPVPVIGITGPPGAGKSTLVDALINGMTAEGKRLGVVCIDPSSPFHRGALLGDRIRMNKWATHPQVFIRSLATRGSLGGLHPMILDITELMKAGGFDYIIVETVGVGQSEVEIVGLSDLTIVVVVPEAGDEVQTMKAGLMEIADLFVVNKADRPGADHFVRNLRLMLAPAFATHQQEVPVIKTVASEGLGVDELLTKISSLLGQEKHLSRKSWLLAERAYHLVQKHRMRDINKESLKESIELALAGNDFNLYRFVQGILQT
jgi:LAO/AO transport system kinase